MDRVDSHQRHVIIVGGGIIGCSVAYQLTLRGYKPTIIEKEPTIAPGASGKAGGFLAKTWNDGSALGPLTRRSYELHKQHGKEFGNTLYRSMDTWSASVHRKGDEKEFSAQNLKWLDSGCCSGLSHLSGEESTAQVHPLRYTEALLAESIKRGAKLTQGKVHDFHRARLDSNDSEERICGVQMIDLKGENVIVSGDIVVVAMGCWSGVLLDPILKCADGPIMSAIRATSIVLQPSGEVPNVALFTDWYTPGEDCSYDPEVYPRPDGTLYICAKADPVDVPPGGTTDVVVDEETTFRIVKFASQLSPLLHDAPVITKQACLLPTTLDDTPLIGEVISGQVYAATGHSCWGILNAPATGEVLAQLIDEGKTTINIDAMDPKRFFGNG